MTESLLPPNATDQEIALSMATGRISAIPVPTRDMWNPDTCPSDKLAWLAWAFGVDEWSDAWAIENKRATIRDAVLVQSRKGSVWSVIRAIENAGYGVVTLTEGLFGNIRDGTFRRNGAIKHGGSSKWATYRVRIDRPISNEQAAKVRRILAVTAPARCSMQEFIYTQAAHLHNGKITARNGTYNRGIA